MLGIRKYTQDYIDRCRARVGRDIGVYRKLAAEKRAAVRKTKPSPALETFEVAYFNSMVLVLDYCFVHRLRTVEGKDGNPLNEVRVLCNSMLLHDNVLTADHSIMLAPDKSILKYQLGDVIKVHAGDFVRLSKAFFAEIESKFL
jgi:hypothetical protein